MAGVFDKALALRGYTVATRKLPHGERLKIALVSDHHASAFGEEQKQLLEMLRGCCPDFIAMTGDIFDDHRPPAEALRLIRGAALIAPVYFVTGNHEYAMDSSAIKKHVRRLGVRVLVDSLAVFRRGALEVLVGGIDDRTAKLLPRGCARLRRIFAPVADSARFSVLLAHRPQKCEQYRQFGFDMVLSGHNHGGQVRLPGICEGVFAPDLRLFPQRPGGIYQNGGQVHIVSRGLAKFPLLPRVFNPPELCVITVFGI